MDCDRGLVDFSRVDQGQQCLVAARVAQLAQGPFL